MPSQANIKGVAERRLVDLIVGEESAKIEPSLEVQHAEFIERVVDDMKDAIRAACHNGEVFDCETWVRDVLLPGETFAVPPGWEW
jgi:chloramphenicol 3-O-phosphotransferase